MDKVHLTKREKEIIVLLASKNYKLDNSSSDFAELEHLEYIGLGKGIKCEFGGYLDYRLTPTAKAYLFENPKLKDPSIFEDSKFWIELVANIL